MPTPDELTLDTIRSWAKRMIDQSAECSPGSHAAGFRLAARYVQAILDVHGMPPETPVHFPESDR